MEDKKDYLKCESIFESYAIYSNIVNDFTWRKVTKKFTDKKILKRGKLLVSFEKKSKTLQSCNFILYNDKLVEEEVFLNQDQSNFGQCKYLYLYFPFLKPVNIGNNHGFSLQSFGKVRNFFCETKSDQLEWIGVLKYSCLLNNVKMDYRFIKVLGSGAFSKVFLAEKIINKKHYAIKSLKKDAIFSKIKEFDSVINEIKILRMLNHPHIIKLFECYESPHYVFLVMQYLEGGELYYQIKEKNKFHEKEAQSIIKGLIETIKYIHDENIIHRDLKPENIILKKKDDIMSFKIVDFGLSVYSRKDDSLIQRCGSPGYVAPEVLLKEGYTNKADIFSIGIISYTLLTGLIPFQAVTYENLIELNKNGYLDYNNEKWNFVSNEAKSFVNMLTLKDPYKRYSADEAQKHPWISMKIKEEEEKSIKLNIECRMIQKDLNSVQDLSPKMEINDELKFNFQMAVQNEKKKLKLYDDISTTNPEMTSILNVMKINRPLIINPNQNLESL